MSNDIDLIYRISKGDQSALTALYEGFSEALYGVVARICTDEGVAQEVLQETFLTIWKKADQYDASKGKPFTWMYRIARNNALNAIRSRKDFIQNEDLSVYSNVGEDGNKEIDTFQLNGRLRSLEAHHQRAIELVYFNGLTHREAHEEMGVPLGTFKSYVQQALRQLRTLYKDELFLFLSISRTLNHG